MEGKVNMKQNKQQKETEQQEQKKKLYKPPQVISYGSVSELTQGAGSPKADAAPNKML